MLTDAAFRTLLECRNCGREWDDTHPARTVVERSAGQEAVVVRNIDCDEFITADCGCCRYVSCPTCELRHDVYVADREPVGEAA